jgi:hypothetical protein
MTLASNHPQNFKDGKQSIAALPSTHHCGWTKRGGCAWASMSPVGVSDIDLRQASGSARYYVLKYEQSFRPVLLAVERTKMLNTVHLVFSHQPMAPRRHVPRQNSLNFSLATELSGEGDENELNFPFLPNIGPYLIQKRRINVFIWFY